MTTQGSNHPNPKFKKPYQGNCFKKKKKNQFTKGKKEIGRIYKLEET